jgi:hypothetical protein
MAPSLSPGEGPVAIQTISIDFSMTYTQLSTGVLSVESNSVFRKQFSPKFRERGIPGSTEVQAISMDFSELVQSWQCL